MSDNSFQVKTFKSVKVFLVMINQREEKTRYKNQSDITTKRIRAI